MRRLPILPTLIAAAAVAIMIALGAWQLQRAEWKQSLIRNLEASSDDRPIARACRIDAVPEVRAGRNRNGETGYRYLIPCGDSDGMMLDIGWSQRPDAIPRVRENRSFTGIRAPGDGPNPILVLTDPLPPLAASGLPSPADLPNNHLLYAIQWFFFALAAAAIYMLALRRWRRE